MEAEQKKILKPLCLAFRHLLERKYDEHGVWHGGDLEERMNALGVWWDRDPIPVEEVSFRSPEDRHAREVIDAYLALREEAGISRKDAIEEFVRETAYTWANRLLVLRCMEARDLIDGVITAKEVYGGRSLAHHRLAQRHPERCTGEDGGLFAMLEEAFAQHARHLPLLFDPRAPGVALRPSVAALKRCIALLSGTKSVNGSGLATDDVFAAPDALGWAYQYWNTEEKDRVFEKVRTKKAKIAGADIIPATQLYTEPYMVKFLVQNSLGATWMGMYPDSDLSEGWEYYVKDADRAPVRRKNVENITFLDPACGSGHFLIEAFDLFYRMYEAEGKYTDEETICKKILSRNLYGIDIDERAVQIARAALWMKAAERVFDFSGTPKNIIATNIRLPKGKDHLKAFLAKHPEDAPLQPALETIFEGLAHADELGSLLQIEEPVEKELRSFRTRLGRQTTLPTGDFTTPTTDEEWEAWKDGVIERLADHFKGEAEAADLSSTFFSQNAGKGVRLFELLSKRYDVVAANPPYMGMGNLNEIIRGYIRDHYLIGKNDLYSVFITRCSELSKNQCQFAMVTQSSWMFLSSYEQFRYDAGKNNPEKGILNTKSFDLLVHLGAGAFDEIGGAVVNVSLMVIRNASPTNITKITGIKLNEIIGANKKSQVLKEVCRGTQQDLVYVKDQFDFKCLDGAPIVYWWPDSVIQLFLDHPKFADFAACKDGTGTRNNSRFIRFHWEVNNNSRWVKHQKGDGYNRWQGGNHFLIDLEYDAARILSTGKSRHQNTDYFFKTGCVWTKVGQLSISSRFIDGSTVFDDATPGCFPPDPNDAYVAVGLLNSLPYVWMVRGLSPSLNYSSGTISTLPWVDIPTGAPKCAIGLAKCLLKYEINSEVFDLSLILKQENLQVQAVLAFTESIIHNDVITALGLDSNTIKLILNELNYPAGFYPIITGYDSFTLLNDTIFNISSEIFDDLTGHERQALSGDYLTTLKANLRTLYEAGPRAKVEIEDDSTAGDGEEEAVAGAYIPIPAETFLEKISQKLQIHPISVYWLLKEGIEQEGWRCIPEERRITEDRFTVMILRMLGHRWPKQIEAGEPVPDWADIDGIIPLTSGTGEATLLERVRMRIAEEFPGGSVAAIEREFEEVMGKSLEDWLYTEFFKHHTQQFKKRPVAWQVQSGKFTKKKQPAFACMVYYHKLDEDTLHKIKNQYVGPLRQRYETEMRGIEGIPAASRNELQERRFRELEVLIAELKVFGETLTDVAENGFSSKTLEKIAKNEPLDSWCSIDGRRPAPADREAFLRQERSYIPDINDGVRVNVVPLQMAGLLAADVIAKKDLEKAVSDRAEWRADERRWCREGKLPKCGWWE
jgi:SAM-dependent methyltransferase